MEDSLVTCPDVSNKLKLFANFMVWMTSYDMWYTYESLVFTPHAQRERCKVIGCSVHILYIYICLWTKKYLNRTLEIDSPFQTFAVGLLVEFID